MVILIICSSLSHFASNVKSQIYLTDISLGSVFDFKSYTFNSLIFSSESSSSSIISLE
ncbi:MAG: hypothetical protein Q8S84_06090 [bacterium]|nr:hypothetical protein [bacterium]MDP3381049.1 hypothetical protein [bacterium]